MGTGCFGGPLRRNEVQLGRKVIKIVVKISHGEIIGSEGRKPVDPYLALRKNSTTFSTSIGWPFRVAGLYIQPRAAWSSTTS